MFKTSSRNQRQLNIKNPPWCNRRTYMERTLLIISILLTILVITFLTLYIVSIHSNPEVQNTIQNLSETNQICNSHGCIGSALKILDYIDSTADPCTDFYQFACGGFLEKSFIPADETSISSFSEINKVVITRLRIILEKPSNAGDPKSFNILKNLYKSCMNTSGIDSEGFEALTHTILRTLGGWPVLESRYWNEDEYDWQTFMYKSRKLGLGTNYFMFIGLEIDKQNSSRRIIAVDEASLEFSRDTLIKGFEDELVQSYYSYMVDIAVLLGADRLSAEVELKKAVAFEIELAKICLTMNELRNTTVLYNPMTLKEVQEKFPGVQWLEFFNNTIDVASLAINEDDIVDISNVNYLKEFIILMKKTSIRVQANYAMFKVISFSIQFLTQDLREREQQYNEAIYGIKEKSPRWKDCINMVTNKFSLAAGALYVREHFNKSAKEKVLEIVSNIREEFFSTLKEANWMDDVTKSKAIEKANFMTYYVAYADELFDDLKLEKYYSELIVNTSSFFNAVLSVNLFKINKTWLKLRKPIDKTDWTSYVSPIVVNAFYSPGKNQIEIPAGILQGIIFNNERPQYLNFGSIGFTVGHEITHGFDDVGRKYDQDGNLKNWWDNSTAAAFLEKAQCIVNQYQEQTVSELNMTLNGANTQGENIADNGGIKMAYKAYQTWVSRNGIEELLPGLNYTQNQLFWISAGNTWCKKVRSRELKHQIVNDFHSPSKFRVEIPFSNTEYFAQDFSCSLDSKMNPKHKCQVW